MKYPTSLLICILIILIESKSTKTIAFNQLEENRTLLASLKALTLGLEYLDSVNEENELIFDALIGVRILADQLQLIVDNLPLDDNFISQLIDMNQQAEDLLTSWSSKSHKNDYAYSSAIEKIVSKDIWSHWNYEMLCTDNNLRFSNLLSIEQTPLNETVSDNCIAQLINSCLISDKCWQIMTGIGYQSYPLSHQIFYLQLGEKFGCRKQMHDHVTYNNQRPLSELKTLFCSNMFNETKSIALKHFPLEYQDYFMECITFCGILGYLEFTDDENWIRQILSWQENIGCYSTKHDCSKRMKRYDKVMSDDCSLHKTAIALASIVVNMRNRLINRINTNGKCQNHIKTLDY